MLFAIFADVRQLEPLGIVEIDLHGRALPGPSQDILDFDVNLGTVKHALPRINPVAHPAALQGRLQRRRGFPPPPRGSPPPPGFWAPGVFSPPPPARGGGARTPRAPRPAGGGGAGGGRGAGPGGAEGGGGV